MSFLERNKSNFLARLLNMLAEMYVAIVEGTNKLNFNISNAVC